MAAGLDASSPATWMSDGTFQGEKTLSPDAMTHLQNNFTWTDENLHPHTVSSVLKGPTSKCIIPDFLVRDRSRRSEVKVAW